MHTDAGRVTHHRNHSTPVTPEGATGRHRRGVPPQVFAYAHSPPARRYGLSPRKGRLGAGADADLVLIDPESAFELTDDTVISKAGWSPYSGRRFRGRVVATYLRGNEIARDGSPHVERTGVFLPGAGARHG